ncbi:transposase [Saccharopolyspora shandongensis]|uniref:transposase n=1 Tax=Saccharopolyspora shandongensis TaxID=418495 RepID=UPI001C43133E|nr:transposase [Saccharopolyspora shandongensis]
MDPLERLLPSGRKPGRLPILTRRQLIDGIRWRTRTRTPWRDVPQRYGPRARVYDLFRRGSETAPGDGSSPNYRPKPTRRT